jgi:hypothetical protein
MTVMSSAFAAAAKAINEPPSRSLIMTSSLFVDSLAPSDLA